MEDMASSLTKEVFINVRVRNPQLHKDDFWHTYIDYEICLHTNSICFSKKKSCVRRRYKDFVWLRQRLRDNALLIQLPKLPAANPFFSFNNLLHVTQRMDGLQKFLEAVFQLPLLLSDSHLHLFLQSKLSLARINACVRGQTRYNVEQAIQSCGNDRSFSLEDKSEGECDSKSICSSGLGNCVGAFIPLKIPSQSGSTVGQFQIMEPQPELIQHSASDN